MTGPLRRFGRRTDGTTALEFGLVAPVAIMIMLWTVDLGLALYVRNTFYNTVGEAARTIYLDPDSDQTSVEDTLAATLSKWDVSPTTSLSQETLHDRDFWVLSASIDYQFRTPFLNQTSWTLTGEARAPVIDYN